MAKFHINSNGVAGPCKAESGGCPFGGETQHYATPEIARQAFEQEMSGASIPQPMSKNGPKNPTETTLSRGTSRIPVVSGSRDKYSNHQKFLETLTANTQSWKNYTEEASDADLRMDRVTAQQMELPQLMTAIAREQYRRSKQ